MLERWIDRMSGGFKSLSAVCLVGMMLTTCADVIGRAVSIPITGAVEIAALFATMVPAIWAGQSMLTILTLSTPPGAS